MRKHEQRTRGGATKSYLGERKDDGHYLSSIQPLAEVKKKKNEEKKIRKGAEREVGVQF